jgi:hypothetical protein
MRLGDFLGVGPPIWTKTFQTGFSHVYILHEQLPKQIATNFVRIKLLYLRTSAFKVKEWWNKFFPFNGRYQTWQS